MSDLTAQVRPDGRSTRWAAHRETRRRELIDSSIVAIRERGANLGMDDFAAAAGTSKTVLYRHFEDRIGLHAAIIDEIEQILITKVREVLVAGPGVTHPRDVVEAGVAAYVELVEQEPHLYRFMMLGPNPELPVMRGDLQLGRGTQSLAQQVRALLDTAAPQSHRSPLVTELWAHSLLGMVRVGVDIWQRSPAPIPRNDLIAALTEIVWHGASTAFHPAKMSSS